MANMQVGLIGRKLGMTQIYGEDGNVSPCTVIQTGPCSVLQVKRSDGHDRYDAVQLGFGAKKLSHATKAEIGHATKASLTPALSMREFRVTSAEAANYEAGKTLTIADLFNLGDKVDVTGTSKGKGFGGVMKKYHFKGFIRSHGTHEYFRHGGSIGTRLTPGMTLKGKKMPGQMGNKRVTVQNLKIARIDSERHLVFLVGGVPGPVGGIVTVRRAVKVAK